MEDNRSAANGVEVDVKEFYSLKGYVEALKETCSELKGRVKALEDSNATMSLGQVRIEEKLDNVLLTINDMKTMNEKRDNEIQTNEKERMSKPEKTLTSIALVIFTALVNFIIGRISK